MIETREVVEGVEIVTEVVGTTYRLTARIMNYRISVVLFHEEWIIPEMREDAALNMIEALIRGIIHDRKPTIPKYLQ